MAISWQPLDLGASAEAHLPPLLISTAFKADSYTIHLTDLTHIWVESLDHNGILSRAEEENTSIDPSDTSQLQILLDKLRLALSPGPKTTLNLHINSDSSRERPTITLNLKTELPGGLAPLEWPIYLAAAPQAVFTSHLTVPLLQTQYARIRELEGLKEVLQEKDHVIQKLLDKLQALGADLGQVFPQATAKSGRKVDRARAEEKVRCLAPFDIEVWRKSYDGQRVQDTAQLVQNVFSGHGTLDMGRSVSADNWWETIGKPETQAKAPSKPTLKEKESTEDNDAFQVQSTPPHLASKALKVSQSKTFDDTTDDEGLDAPSQRSKIPDSFPSSQPLASVSSPKQGKKFSKIGGKKQSPLPHKNVSTDDSDPSPARSTKIWGKIGGPEEVKSAKAPLPIEDETTDDEQATVPLKTGPTKSPTPESASSPEPTKLKFGEGKIGGKKSRSPEASSSSEEAPKPRKGKLGQIGSRKRRPTPESSDEAPKPRKRKLGQIGERKKETSPSPSRSAEEAHKPRKAKLGQIGGRKKEASPSPSVSGNEAPVSPNAIKRKLGAIGNRQKSPHGEITAAAAGEEEPRGRSVKVDKERTPPPRETSEERAEKKRLQLKRELEEKAKAPVKKKRKF